MNVESPREKVLTILTNCGRQSENDLRIKTGLSVCKLNEAILDLLFEERISSTDKLLNDDVYYELVAETAPTQNIVQFPTTL